MSQEIIRNTLAPDLTYYLQKGDDATLNVTFHGSGYTPAEGDAVTFTVREYLDGPVLISKTTTEYTEEPADSGHYRFVIEIDHADTLDMTPGTYVYDVQMAWGGQRITTIIPPHRLILLGEVTY